MVTWPVIIFKTHLRAWLTLYLCEKRSVPFLAHYSGLAIRVTVVSALCSEPFLSDSVDGTTGVVVYNRALAARGRFAVSCSCKRIHS